MIIRISETTCVNLKSLELIKIYVSSTQTTPFDLVTGMYVDYKLKDYKIKTEMILRINGLREGAAMLESKLNDHLNLYICDSRDYIDLFKYARSFSIRELEEEFFENVLQGIK